MIDFINTEFIYESSKDLSLKEFTYSFEKVKSTYCAEKVAVERQQLLDL